MNNSFLSKIREVMCCPSGKCMYSNPAMCDAHDPHRFTTVNLHQSSEAVLKFIKTKWIDHTNMSTNNQLRNGDHPV